MLTLGPKGIAFFENRGISVETAVRYGVYTAGRRPDGKIAPASGGDILVFPYFEFGRVVNEKYRLIAEKKFWQWPRGKQIFWNVDCLDDPLLESGAQPLVLTEGEIDALSAIDSGWPFTVSVPSGAPPANSNGNNNPEDEASGKFEFMWAARDRLKTIQRFILAVDNDPPGQRLAAEIVRRLGAVRCYFVEYPAGCKDLNDVLVKHGCMAVTSLLNAAKPYPVQGVYKLSDYPEAEDLLTVSTGWYTLDNHLRLFPGEFCVVTGIPGHGKSTFVLNLLVNLAAAQRWRAAIFSPEMPVVPQLREMLRRIVGGSAAEADAFVGEYFRFLDIDPADKDKDEEIDLDWVLERAADAVMRDGIRVLVIDPWNELECQRDRGESMGDYIGRGLRSIKRFARRYEVACIVVCHPTKEVGKEGKSRPPTLYDCADSAHWFNKPDHGLVVYRPEEEGPTTIRISKVRFMGTGEKGTVKMNYDRATCRFSPMVEQAPEPPADVVF